jgi:hypothetical protein
LAVTRAIAPTEIDAAMRRPDTLSIALSVQSNPDEHNTALGLASTAGAPSLRRELEVIEIECRRHRATDERPVTE